MTEGVRTVAKRQRSVTKTKDPERIRDLSRPQTPRLFTEVSRTGRRACFREHPKGHRGVRRETEKVVCETGGPTRDGGFGPVENKCIRAPTPWRGQLSQFQCLLANRYVGPPLILAVHLIQEPPPITDWPKLPLGMAAGPSSS